MRLPEIFLSYSWSSKVTANKIFSDLIFLGFKVFKDDQTLKYTDRISEFMANIKKSDFAILIISDDYLKSINCMTEVMLLRDNPSLWNKALPILEKDVRLYELTDRIGYIDYWQQKSRKIEAALKNIDSKNSALIRGELNNHIQITENIDSLLSDLKDQLNITTDELFDTFYRPLTDKMRVEPNFGLMTELIPISFTPDPSKRLKLIMEFYQKYQVEHTWCESIKASAYRDLGKPKKAVHHYKRAIELDPFYSLAWNNLGRVYETQLKNYSAAKKCYLKAIEGSPEFDVPRLNLGLLLSDRLNDLKGAVYQYEKILEFDENNAKAHNNLGNIYRGTYQNNEYKDHKKAEMHFLIAVSQDLTEALVNYGNFLQNDKKNPKKARELYIKAKDIDENKELTEVLDLLITLTEKQERN